MDPITELQHRRFRKRLQATLGDVEQMKAQLAQVRATCRELEQQMRAIREAGEARKQEAERRRNLRRVV